jgi:hypothetical protein
MSPERSKELVDIYPDLFSDIDSRMPYQLFGFECHDGWFDLLKDLIDNLKIMCSKEDFYTGFYDDEVVPLKVDQVKEKFGTLRFYVNWENDSIRAAIKVAEKRSAETCEFCGNPGKMTQRGYWLQTLCDECYQKRCGE